MSEVLSEEEINTYLKKCPEWDVEDDSLSRTFEFEEFSETIDFVNDIAEVVEEAQHHPDIDIRYRNVSIYLTTHEQNGITELDFEMACRIDNLI